MSEEGAERRRGTAANARGGVVVLGKFVDALRLSVYGPLDDERIEELGRLRSALEKSGKGRARVGSIPYVPGGDIFLLPRSRGQYQLVLKNEAIYLEVTTRPNLPAIIVQFRTHLLYEYDLEGLEAIVHRIGHYFLSPSYSYRVSRFDLALDFQADGWELPAMEDVITRARKKSIDEFMGTIPVCMTLGKRNGILQVQIYNKTEELKKSQKTWMYEIYGANDQYNESLSVWRVEMRFFGKVLREMGVDTISDLSSSLGDLVRVVVGGEGVKPWLRMTDPTCRDVRRDRRRAAPWWEQVSASLLAGRPTTGRLRNKNRSRHPSYEHTMTMVLAYSKKLAALEKAEGHDCGDTIDAFLDLLKGHLLEDASSKGLSWAQLVEREADRLGIVTDL